MVRKKKDRFYVHEDSVTGGYFIFDTLYGEHLLLFDVKEHIQRTCNLLNSLYNENIKLHEENRDLTWKIEDMK